MIRLVLLRHAPTDWNADRRLQGRADTPLSEAGRAVFAGVRLPAAYRQRGWHVSPLRRARETAALLGITPVVEPALIEMDWGDYERKTLAELHAELGDAFVANEGRGLDFQPPGGESPRQVQNRLRPWLQRLAAGKDDVGAITHKGVIRAILAEAYNWPMIGRPPVKLDWTCLHEFLVATDGRPEPLAMNIPLE